MKSFLRKYRDSLWENCMDSANVQTNTVYYWQNYLFTKTVELVIPLSLIILIAGGVYGLFQNLYLIVLPNLGSFLLVLYLGFGKKLSLKTRKVLLMFCAYFAGTYYLIIMGFRGPGFLFLYAACIFAILMLPVKYAYLWSWINVGICVLMTLIVQFQWSPVEEVNAISAVEWMAISVNLLYLSFFTSYILPKLFIGLSTSLNNEKVLQYQLSEKSKALEATLVDLERKNDDLEQFAYLASHDLQEPLRMISSFLSQLKKKYGDSLDEKAHQYIHFAVDASQRMRNIIQDLLQLSRVGRHEGVMETLDLNQIVNEVTHIEQRRIEASSAQIHFSKLPSVKSFRTPLMQIFQNIISNALKYRKETEPPEINVRAKELKDEWEISISDNGIGMEDEYLDKIFAIFQRLHGKGEYSGTGIGLAIVKKNIDQMGGRIWVTSTPGKGSTFHFTLLK